jgi:PAS domain S-box-containing protein
MDKENSPISTNPRLRQMAEQMLETGEPVQQLDGDADLSELLHELHVCHAELEIQNSELRRTQVDFETATRRYRELFEVAPVGYLVLDRQGMIHEMNETCLDLLGLQREGNVQRPFLLHVHLNDKPAFIRLLRQVFENGAEQSQEFSFRRIDGTVFPGLINSSLLPGTAGKQQVLCALSDISEIKQAEQQQRQQQQQLRQVQKMEAIGRLAGGVAHDFNNLLAGIIGHAELLRTMLGNSSFRTTVDTILRTAERASVLTRNLLTFSRKADRQNTLVDIHTVVRDVMQLLSHTLDRRITIRTELNASPCVVKGDASLLQTALLNLAINARDAMPSGGELLLSTDVVDLDPDNAPADLQHLPAGQCIEICVKDTGTGMSKQTVEHLFEPFYTTKKVGKGTGLGLSMVYGTVRDHEGAIEVFSEQGRGSLFKITLPLSAEAAGAKPAGEPPAPLTESASGRILLVDDEEIIRDMANEALELMGYDVTTAIDGEDAVRVFRERHEQIDLVILDAMMPKMNGRQALAEMKKIDPNVRAIMSSGYALDMEMNELEAEGFLGFVEKPYRIATMAQKVAQCLADSKKHVAA